VIRDLRWASADQVVTDGWIGEKEVIAVFIVGIKINRRRFFYFHGLMACVSLHALARRYQRAFDSLDAAIRADMIALAIASTGPQTGRFSVRCPDGAWAGRAQSTWCLGVRTFLSEDQLAGAIFATS
jgi:hypothetical protein